MRVSEVLRKVAEGIKDSHVELIVLLWTKSGRSEFRDKSRSGRLSSVSLLAFSVTTTTYPHLSASISFPGVSRHLRIIMDCCRTTPNASSNNLPWSSIAAGGVVAMTALPSGGLCGEILQH